jgi:hypothetical protein
MSIPYTEWTDDEWIRAMREFVPDTAPDVVEAAVARWRQEGEDHEQ